MNLSNLNLDNLYMTHEERKPNAAMPLMRNGNNNCTMRFCVNDQDIKQLGSRMSTSKSKIFAIPNSSLSLFGHSKSTSPIILANWAQLKIISSDATFLETVTFIMYQPITNTIIIMIVPPVPIHVRHCSNKLKYPSSHPAHNL